MQETGSDRDADGNSDLDNEVNELMHDMMMNNNCQFHNCINIYSNFSEKIS